MPRKVDVNTSHDKKWNLYVNEVEKLEYLSALIAAGHRDAQSAGVRAMMHLYVTDPVVRDKVNAIIDDFIVYKKDGNPSKL